MRLFEDINKTYKTPENALAAAEKKIPGILSKYHYVVATNSEGRYYLVFIGQEAFYLVHSNFCVVF